MPLIQKTVYIREEDVPAWNALPNKAEFISKHLSLANSPLMKPTASEVPLVAKPATNPIIKTKADALEAVKPLARDDGWVGPLWKKGKK